MMHFDRGVIPFKELLKPHVSGPQYFGLPIRVMGPVINGYELKRKILEEDLRARLGKLGVPHTSGCTNSF